MTPISNVHLIGLSGYGRSGKDSVANIFKEWGWKRVAFADKLREALEAINPIIDPSNGMLLSQLLPDYGWDQLKTEFPEARRLQQTVGTEMGRVLFGEDFWVAAAFRDMNFRQANVITDVRFPNEAKAIKAKGGEILRVIRPGYGPVNDHISEVALDDWVFPENNIIYNSGTLDDLRREVAGWGLI